MSPLVPPGVSPLVLHWPEIDPVAFRIGPLSVHWYALMYLLAFGIGYVLLRRRLRHQPYARITQPKPWTREDVEDILFAAITGVIVGGRLGFCLFYQPEKYLADPLSILYLWEGGMSFHGGAIGVALALLVYAWRRKRPFLEVTDFLVPAAPTGLAAGRLGNFINGELWGREADPSLPWAMVFPAAGPDARHPSQLYQFAGEGLLLAALLWWYARTERPRGQVSAFFLMGYGVFRFLAEYFREPDEYLGVRGLGMTMGQWLSLPMILGGLALWLWARHKNIRPPLAEAAPAADEAAPAADETGDPDKTNDTVETETTADGSAADESIAGEAPSTADAPADEASAEGGDDAVVKPADKADATDPATRRTGPQ